MSIKTKIAALALATLAMSSSPSPTHAQAKFFGWGWSVGAVLVGAAMTLFLALRYSTDEPLLIKWLPVLPTY